MSISLARVVQLGKKYLDKLIKDKKEDADNRSVFKGEKARGIVHCGNCCALRVVHSMFESGSSLGGPKEKHIAKLEQYIKNRGYVCGEDITILFYSTRASLR